jgi:dTDP-glucose pyrophosphorylase
MQQFDTAWGEAVLPLNSSVEDAIKSLNRSSLRIVLVVSSDGKLLGTISDGDIRRQLLKGLKITDSIQSLININPIVAKLGSDRNSVLSLMWEKKLYQVPLVNDEGKLIGLHLWEELAANKERSNLMIIMAGGKGTRLLPKTSRIPKPMLPIGGKPILEHIVNRAKKEGFYRFVFAIHHLGEVIEEYFGDGKSLDVKINYLREEIPLSTAGSLSLFETIPTEPFIVTNGDVLSEIRYGDMLDFHIQQDACGTMAVQVHEFQNPFGVVQTEGFEITGYEEKPTFSSLINAGVYVLDPKALSVLVPSQPCTMPSLFEKLKTQGLRTIVYPVHELWTDIGRHEDLQRASLAMSESELM